MARIIGIVLLSLVQAIHAQSSFIVASTSPASAGTPLPAFISYSIEFCFFPDYAGNTSNPNTFSNNLLNNLGHFQGSKPHIRVGGNTQDYALYNASLPYAVNGTFNAAKAADYPTTVYIGPSYFESYSTWPDVKFSHGFNMGLGGSSSAGWQTLLDTVPLACKALEGGKLLMWEYGNEPDLFSTSAQGPVRPPSWNESTYVSQWLNGSRQIKEGVAAACPDLASYGFMAPSFAGVENHLNPVTTWNDGLDVDKDIELISSHNYIGGATQPGVTLQGTLMNHTQTVISVARQLNVSNLLASSNIPFILGETNSLYNQGAPGLSNAYGAALWNLDFALYGASKNIHRIQYVKFLETIPPDFHIDNPSRSFHTGLSFRYAAWQPQDTEINPKGTKPPYYGNIATAAFLSNLTASTITIAEIPLSNAMESAYAAYANGALKRIIIINMHEYNYTVNGTSTVLNPVPRPIRNYTVTIPSHATNSPDYYAPAPLPKSATLRALHANGSDAITGITYDGYSYNYELNNGLPVRLTNVTVGQKVRVVGGKLIVPVEDSGAVTIDFGA
ncbi:glycoside hydrolase family 79 protein [Sclerotinia borealis F-4128]|uniref:Glycoside hydrolase family 79 protein n=1 Tax=Sclerotinia borealis (strain F-4128) TaxID=1432307 RepID=W9CJM0_SCLBF|nr:glycoside hydrolase family 79 protein [Sclerotinia borealis F-4128]